jgi:hypothetical protein
LKLPVDPSFPKRSNWDKMISSHGKEESVYRDITRLIFYLNK